jgi:hypothetical protein
MILKSVFWPVCIFNYTITAKLTVLRQPFTAGRNLKSVQELYVLSYRFLFQTWIGKRAKSAYRQFDPRSQSWLLGWFFSCIAGKCLFFLSKWQVAFWALCFYMLEQSSLGRFWKRGGSATLKVDSKKWDNIFSTLGLRVSIPAHKNVNLKTELFWKHTYGSLAPYSSTSFLEGSGRFRVRGNALAMKF